MGIWDNFKSALGFEDKIEVVASQPEQPMVTEAHAQALAAQAKEHGKLSGFLESNKSLTSAEQYQVSAAYSTVYTQVSQVRKKMYMDIERIKNTYIADIILNQVTEDALAPDVSTGEILEITSDKEEIQREIDFLDEKFNFDQMIQSITPDMLAYGEYTLRTDINPVDAKQGEGLNEDYDYEPERITEEEEVENKDAGLHDLYDDVLQHSVIALTKFGDIKSYLVQGEKGQIQKAPPSAFVQFSVINRTVRVDIYEHFASGHVNGIRINKDILKKLPRFVRVGKSLLFPILSKVKELELLEQLVPASKISKMSNGTMIGVQVPPGYELEKALHLSKKIEGLVNRKISLDLSKDEVSVSNILNTAGQVKVIPLFGDKGQTQKMDIQSDEPDDLLSSVKDIREVITSSVGIPYEILFSDDNANKAEMLKRYARYLRLLKNVQRSIVRGINQIIMIHLANKNIPFTSEDIEINFRNKLIEIDSLDRLEFLDSSISMIDNIKTFVNDLAEEDSPYKDAINLNVFLDFIDTQLSMVGLAGLVDSEVEIQPNNIPDDEEDGVE